MSKLFQRIILVVLAALLGLASVGLFLTRGITSPSTRKPTDSSAAAHAHMVDEKPLTTAESLAALAATPREQRYAEDAVRLADQEVDLAFATALRHAAQRTTPLTPEARELQTRVNQTQARVAGKQAEIISLTKQVAAARSTSRKENLEAQLQFVQAQLSLDQDTLEDARRDLARAGGDEQSILQRELEQHEASQAHVVTDKSSSRPVLGQPAGAELTAPSLLARWQAWGGLRAELQQLNQALADSKARQGQLVAAHNAQEKTVQAEADNEKPLAPTAQGAPAAPGANAPAQPSSPNLAKLHRLQRNQQDLADLDNRIDAEQKLGDVYTKWVRFVSGRELAALNRVILSGFWLVLIVVVAFVADSSVSRFYTEMSQDRKGLLTARAVLHFSIRALGVVLILVIVFGPPSQLATVLALAGAGLTVALKDFLVGFSGWFVLMGHNGVRPGDWVEINGVQGKVIEVGLLHTVIMETGNWTAAGHPTGRKVTFVNSYAIEGHYFNFSTAGQWLWDEVLVGLPIGTNPYPIVEAIQKLVAAETEANARLSEQEWRQASATSGLRSFSAEPSISVRPTDSGVNVIVRYITRADERDDLRLRLYRSIYELLIRTNVLHPGMEVSAAAPAARDRD